MSMSRRRPGTGAMAKWAVSTMDSDGFLFVGATRKACVAWIHTQDESPILNRYSYGGGSYEYVTGFADEDDRESWFVRKLRPEDDQ